MSSLIIEVCEINDILPHPNADKLEIAQIKGWRCIVQKNQFQKGQKIVYFPPDSILPGPLAEKLNVAKYLKALPKELDGKRPDGGRVSVARLRGEKSYGFIAACEQDWPIETNVAEYYNVTKWEPPAPCEDGDAERPHPGFVRYTNIENYRNFPNLFKEGEEVIFTEKLHGMNTRCAIIKTTDHELGWDYMVGSHDVRRKMCYIKKKNIIDENGNPQVQLTNGTSKFWDAMTQSVIKLLHFISDGNIMKDVIIFSEIIGQGIQDMHYGTKFDFRVFDIMVEGKYLDFDDKICYLNKFNIPHVPILYRGPFSHKKVEEYVDGPTTMCAKELAGSFSGREGIVITPIKERYDPDLKGDGRVILKAVSFAYQERKNGSEYH